MSTLRKFGAQFRAEWNLVIEYRLSVLIWIVTIVLPLIMMAAWVSVASNGRIGQYDRLGFIAYYVAAFVVRNMTGAWFIWEMDKDIRMGQISFQLLKPMNPMIRYMALNLASKPLRLVIMTPLVLLIVKLVPGLNLASDPLLLALFGLSLAGAWAILFLMQYTIGLSGFWTTRTISLNEAWFFLFSLASGYLVPLDLFPAALREIALLLPFRFAMSLPVEILTGRLPATAAAQGILLQWFWVGALYGLCRAVWHRGLRRYSAVGA
jgi:ABC-2 type transport system permease protein